LFFFEIGLNYISMPPEIRASKEVMDYQRQMLGCIEDPRTLEDSVRDLELKGGTSISRTDRVKDYLKDIIFDIRYPNDEQFVIGGSAQVFSELLRDRRVRQQKQ
jgi:hypothetical protein